jgi:hypothetical protein
LDLDARAAVWVLAGIGAGPDESPGDSNSQIALRICVSNSTVMSPPEKPEANRAVMIGPSASGRL